MKNMLLFSFVRKSSSLKGIRLWIILLGIFTSISLNAQDDLWLLKADLGEEPPSMNRSGAISFSIGSTVYFGLGTNGTTYFKDLWAYDAATDVWLQKADFPGAGVAGAFAMVMNNFAIVGTGEKAGGLESDVVYKFNPGTNGWTAVTNYPYPVSFASAFSIGIDGFVVGGDDGTAFRNELFEYDFNTNTWIGLTTFPGTARIKAFAFNIGNTGYYGTGEIGGGVYTKDFYSYNTTTGGWTALTDFDGALRAGAIGCSNGTLGFVGLGYNGSYLNDFYSFDGSTWTSQTNFIGNTRELAVASSIGNKVYLGTGKEGTSYYKDFYEWDLCALPIIVENGGPVGIPAACEGADVTFNVTVSNITPSTIYQWKTDDGSVIGTTNPFTISGVVTTDNGTYTCHVTNDCGTSISEEAELTVIPLPLAAPTGLNVSPDLLCPENIFNITLNADNNGIETDTLKWYSSSCGGILEGIGYNGIEISPPNPLAKTLYYARWENQCGVSDCEVDSVEVVDLAVIPASISVSIDTICHDYDDSLFLSIEGGTGDSLVWYIGDICNDPSTAIRLDTGIKIDLYTLRQIPTETTTYSARWETFCGGTDFSSDCLLVDVVVNGEFSITDQPSNILECEGADSLFFAVGAELSSSITTVKYQWYFKNTPLSDETSDSLWFYDPLTLSDTGYYQCKVYNTCDTVFSDSAYLALNTGANIILEPFGPSVLCEGGGDTLIVQGEGSLTVNYSWYFNDALTAITDSFFIINPATSDHSGDYYCIAYNGCGDDTSNVVSIIVDSLPYVTVQPRDTIVCLNETAEFLISAEGSTPLSYQWFKIDDADISTELTGETSTLYKILNVQVTDTVFDYYCVISNLCSDINSDTASVAMYPPVMAIDSMISDTNNLCISYPTDIILTVIGGSGDSVKWFTDVCDGDLYATTIDTILSIPVPLLTTTYYAKWITPCGVSNCDSITIIIKEDPIVPDTISATSDTICYDYNNELYLYASGGSGDSLVWYQGDICADPGNAVYLATGDTLDLFALGQVPSMQTTYSVRWEQYCGADETYTECLTYTIYVDGTISITGPQVVNGICEGQDTVQYSIVVDESQSISELTYQWYFDGLLMSGFDSDTLTLLGVTAADTGYYYCEVNHNCGIVNSDSVKLSMTLYPYITVQPMLLDTICEGDTVNLNFHAEGSSELQYQWYFNNIALPEVDTFLTIAPVDFTHSGVYYSTITNFCGMVSTDTISFEVDTIPYFIQLPEDQTACLNGTATFEAIAEGTLPLSYQWYKMNSSDEITAIPGEIGTTLIIAPVLFEDTSFRYLCFVNNECSELKSDTVNLFMYPQVEAMDSITTDTNNLCTNYPTDIILSVYGGAGDSIRWFTGACDGDFLDVSKDTILSITVPDITTTYYARWETPCAISACDSITIYIKDEPVNPDSVFANLDLICFNYSDELYLVAEGGSGDSLVWYQGDVCSNPDDAIYLATGDTLDLFALGQIPNIQTTYSVRWEKYCGPEESYSVCLTYDILIDGSFSISGPYTIDDGICEGQDTVQYYVKLEENQSISDINYQWLFNGVLISDAINDTLTLLDVMASDTGSYRCEISNDCETILTDSVILQMTLLPQITTQPEVETLICEGDSVLLTMETEGSSTLYKQWFFNEEEMSYTDTSVLIYPVSFVNNGDYYCTVTNYCGMVSTDTVSIKVDTIPFVIEQPIDVDACVNGLAEFIIVADGSLPIAYQWYKINGDNLSSEILGEIDNSFTIAPVLADDANYGYFCMISNQCSDGVSSDTVNINILGDIEAPINVIASDTNICITHPNLIDLIVIGGYGDSIAWYTGSCGGILDTILVDTVHTIIPPVVTTTYYARWQSECGISACDSVTIIVSRAPESIDSLSFDYNGICSDAYDSILITAHGGKGDLIYWIEGLDCNSEPVAITTDTFCYIPVIPESNMVYSAKWVNECGSSACVRKQLNINTPASIIDFPEFVEVCEGERAEIWIDAFGKYPLEYQWFDINGPLTLETDSVLVIDPVEELVLGNYYCVVSNACDSDTSDLIPLTMLLDPFFDDSDSFSDSTMCEGDNLTLIVNPSGLEPITTKWFKNGFPLTNNFLPDNESLVIETLINTASYFAVIRNYCESEIFSDTVTITVLDTTIINTQPSPVEVCLQGTAVFEVHADTTPFVEYYWYKDNPPTIVGTGSVLEILNVGYGDEGDYYCEIIDFCGSIISDKVTLDVIIAPSYTPPLTSLAFCEGDYTAYDLSESVGENLEFRWWFREKNGLTYLIVPGETGSVLEFDPVEPGHEGNYFAEVYNDCGTEYSDTAYLTVKHLPNPLTSVTATPESVCTDDTTMINLVGIGGGGGFGDSYIAWYMDECSSNVSDQIEIGDNVFVEKQNETTVYFAQWVNECVLDLNLTNCISDTVFFIPDPLPSSIIETSDTVICYDYGNDIILTASDDGVGDTITWYIVEVDTLIPLGLNGLEVELSQPLDTTVYAAIWSNQCGESEMTTIQIDVTPLPVISTIGFDSICASPKDDNIYEVDSLMVSASYYSSIKWTSSSPTGYFSDDTLLSPIYYDTNIESYDTVIVLLIVNVDGYLPCGSTQDTIKLVYMPLSMPSVYPELLAICRDSIIILEASGADSYTWVLKEDPTNTVHGDTVYFSPVETSDYWLIGESDYGCLDSTEFTIDVYPTPLVDLGDSLFMYSCEPVQLDAGGGDGSEYWIWNNGFRTRTITVYETGSYSVIVGNPGCEVSDTGYISLCNGRMFMPTAFTPNADGLNEKFKPITSDPSVEFHMMIFDRLGKMLFETYDIYEGWDGDVEGDACPAGNYVWRIDYQGQGTSAPGKKGSKVGTVMLVR